MTCIVGLVDKEEDKVYIGADSAGVAGLDLMIRADQKAFNVGEFVFGFTTSFRMGQILQYSFDPPEIRTKDIMRYMVTDFVDAVREALKEGGYSEVENNVETGGCFLVGVRSRLFSIEDDYQVEETPYGFNSAGCGAQIALGSLVTTQDYDFSPRERVKMALQAAEKFSSGVRGPFNIKTSRKAK